MAATTNPMHSPMPHDRRSAAQLLAETREAIEPAHRAAVDALPSEIRHIAGYHIGWWNAEGHPSATTGKSIRPALVLACARAVAGEGYTPGLQCAVAAAVAIELVHDFSLLHDDVMDRDLIRRHRPAAWSVFGASQAILVGDMLLTVAIDQVSDDPVMVKALVAALMRLCAGETADLAFETRAEVTVAECLAMTEDKTGALLGAACELGALAAGAVPDLTRCYRLFGQQLGVAFQLVDDLLGIWGDGEDTGKPIGSDLASRKKSLPVVAALNAGNSAARRLAQLYRSGEALSRRDIAHAAELIESAGGREWASAEAARRVRAAAGHLAAAGPHPRAAVDLAVLGELITQRNR